MELEFFIHPNKECNALTKEHKKTTFQFLSSEEQDKSNKITSISIADLLKAKKLTEWHAYWLAEMYIWYTKILKFSKENIRVREHTNKELSHYSSATFDIDYKFPFGFKEILGIANRGTYDLTQHQEHSKSKLEVFDEASQEKVMPTVIEPSQGVDRLFLAMLFEAYKDDKERGNIVLHLPNEFAPTYCSVFPLVKNKEEVLSKAKKVYEMLRTEFTTSFDVSGSIGRRYARADELGTPYCITIDFEEDDSVTVRHRDSTKQERVKVKELVSYLRK